MTFLSLAFFPEKANYSVMTCLVISVILLENQSSAHTQKNEPLSE